MGLFNRIFSRPTIQQTQETSPSHAYACKAALALPPYTSPEDHQAWQTELYNMNGLLQEIDELQDINGARDQEKLIQGGPLRPVHRDTLLERAHFADPKYLSHRLHANRLPGSVVVMATPTFKQRQLWNHDAKEYKVSHVVRIGTDVENVMLDLCPREPVIPTRKPEVAAATVPSRHWEVNLEPDVAVPPSVLLETLDTLSTRKPIDGYRVAFQSPNGDDRSAVFAAAWKVYRDLTAAAEAKQPIDDNRVKNSVRDAVLQMRMARSTTLLTEAGHVASILAMGMQLKERLQAHRVRFSPVEQGRIFTERPTEPSASSPSLDRARNLATARGICQDIRTQHAETDVPFAALKGSTAGSRRIRQDRMLKPEARLQKLNDAPSRLVGAWATPKTMVLERPGPDRSLAWAVACLTHNIAAVVDLSDAGASKPPHAMPPGTRTFANATSATFAVGRLGEVMMTNKLPGGSSIGMNVSASIEGEAVTRDVSGDPPYMDPESRIPTERPLELIHVPLAKGKPVPPGVLLEISKILEAYRGDAPGDAIAVQGAGGDVRTAVVVAADQLFCKFQEGKLDATNRTEVIQDIWTRLCLDYSIDLADEPEQLASLLAFADLVLAEGVRTARWQE